MKTFLLRLLAGALALFFTGLGATSIVDPQHTPAMAWVWMVLGMVLAYFAFTGRIPFTGGGGAKRG